MRPDPTLASFGRIVEWVARRDERRPDARAGDPPPPGSPPDPAGAAGTDGQAVSPAAYAHRSAKPAGTAPVRRRYDATYRAEAVRRATEPGARISAVAAELGIGASTLRRWVRASAEAAATGAHAAAEARPPAAPERPPEPSQRPPPEPPPKPAAQPAPKPPSGPPAQLETAPFHPGDDIFPRLSAILPAYRFPIVLALLLGAVLVSRFVPVDYPWRPVAVAVHVVALVTSLGPILLIDWYGLLWLTGHRGLTESARLAAAAGPLIWGGLGGLIASGALLHPNLSSPLTVLKLVLVLAVGWNGAAMSILRKRIAALPPGTTRDRLPPRDWRLMLTTTAISQVGWWGASIIGFLNVRR